jgi:glycolate oxidase FAD binding subunit
VDDGGVGAMIAERVRDAHAAGRRLRVRGEGTWLAAGRPVESADTISLAGDRGIVEYVPGDLTLTARAGTPMSEIVAATAEQGQWLPLDPWGGDAGTLGATVSTGTAGPYSHAMGLPRDAVLGLEFVNGRGQVIRSGGRVVKNVAGFDLTRLMVGSWGTLGVITEITVRLRACADRTRTLAFAQPESALSDLAVRLRALPFTPIASELVNDRLASRLGAGSAGGASLLLRVGGNEKSLRTQIDLLRSFGEVQELDEGVWDSLRTAAPGDAASWRWSRLPTEFGQTWGAAVAATRALDGALIHGNPARGVVRVTATAQSGSDVASVATSFRGCVTIEQLPRDAWPRVDTVVAADPISRAIRAKFDPAGILNAGILGEVP